MATQAFAIPLHTIDVADVPERTSVSFLHSWTGEHRGTGNEHEPRSGLSVVKLYIADYALRRGDGDLADRTLAERMIRASDNEAADILSVKYPEAISEIAWEYDLQETSTPGFWGNTVTSAADIVSFVDQLKRTAPHSPIFRWMARPAEYMATGFAQDYGTALLPGALGTKWGLGDLEAPPMAASVSFGIDFTVAAITHGTPDEHTADVLGILASPTPPPSALGLIFMAIAQQHPVPVPDIVRKLATRALSPEGALRAALRPQSR